MQEVPLQPSDKLNKRISWHYTFAAFKHHNYRLWFIGQVVSLMGTWMQSTAQGYLIFELTHSPAFLGYVGFAAGIPTWLFMLYGGVVADRISRRTLLIYTQTIMMALAFALSILTFTCLVRPWHIIVLASALGVTMAFDAPARQAFVLELVGKKDMTNAIALNSIMFNSATAVGPAVAGISYSLSGPGWCFLINGISYLAVIGALFFMKIDNVQQPHKRKSAQQELREGIGYIIHQPIIRTLILLVGVTSLFGFSFVVLIPAWAVKVLHGGATLNGLLQSARGVGALLSALLIALLGHFHIKGKMLTAGTLFFPVLLLLFSYIHWVPISLIVLVGVGAALIQIMNLANALVQELIPDALRGRVMSVYSLTFFGIIPLGALWVGTAAEQVGEPTAVKIGALASLIVSIMIFIWVPGIRKLH